MRYEVYEKQEPFMPTDLFYGYETTLEDAIYLGEETGCGTEFYVLL